jgi:hypothetical protein
VHQYAHVPAYVLAENMVAERGRSVLGDPKLVILPSPQSLSEKAWQALLHYVEEGGHLLLTGSVDRDPYWRPTARVRELVAGAKESPINLRGATIRIGTTDIPVNYSQEMQYHLERLAFADHASFKAVRHGRGMVYLVSDPVELAEGAESAAAVYNAIFRLAGVQSPYIVRKLSSAVLVRPVVLKSSVLYLLMSESKDPEEVDVADRQTGVPISLRLGPGRAALVLLDRSKKAISGKCCD